MTPRLWDRIATLLKADAHGVVDALEERSLLVKQCLREAELELLQKRARLEALDAEGRRLDSEIERCQDEILRLDEDVNLALDGGKEELARFAIRRLLPRRERASALATRRAAVAEAHARLAEQLAAQETGLAELRQRARARLVACSRSTEGASDDAAAVAEPEVELELMRRREGGAAETAR